MPTLPYEPGRPRSSNGERPWKSPPKRIGSFPIPAFKPPRPRATWSGSSPRSRYAGGSRPGGNSSSRCARRAVGAASHAADVEGTTSGDHRRPGLTAALVCYGHYTLTGRQIDDLSAQTKAIRDQVTSLAALKKQGTDLATKRNKARGEMQALSDKVQDCTTTLAAHRLRWKKLLELLAEHRPQHLVVQKIDSTGERLNITGLCLGPHPANELASDLETRLRELGWRIQPARQEAGKALAGGDPWKFELVLKDFIPAAVATAAVVLRGPAFLSSR